MAFGITVISVEKSVVEVRETYMKMVRRGYMLESHAIQIVREFAREKEQAKPGQTTITIIR